jgi:hypothetical protein
VTGAATSWKWLYNGTPWAGKDNASNFAATWGPVHAGRTLTIGVVATNANGSDTASVQVRVLGPDDSVGCV